MYIAWVPEYVGRFHLQLGLLDLEWFHGGGWAPSRVVWRLVPEDLRRRAGG